MAKRTLYPLFTEADAAAVRPILDALNEKGFPASTRKAPKEGGTILFFISENLKEDSPEADEFLRYDAQRCEIIPVSLDGSAPPSLIENAIRARNTIFAERYTSGELADRIAEAMQEPAETVSRIRNRIIAAAAVILLAVLGFILWRVLSKKEEPPQETTEAETPVPTTVSLLPGDIPPEDAERIRELVFTGDVYHWYTADDGDYEDPEYAKYCDEFAYRYTDEDGTAHWISTEDGHEIAAARYDDLSWLTALPNLACLTLVRVDAALPDLSGLPRLSKIFISDTELSDLSFLAGSPAAQITYAGDHISNFSALNSCPGLRRIDLDLSRTTAVDFSDFAPAAAEYLSIANGSGISPVDLSGLKGKAPEMKRLQLRNLTPRDLSFLEGMERLEQLDLRFMSLRTLDGIEGLKNLKILSLQDVSDLADISAVAGCTALEEFRMTGYPENVTVSDLSALGKLPNLFYLSNVAAMNTDLDFLKELPTKEDVIFVLVNLAVTDYSGFSAIHSFQWLYMNMDRIGSPQSDPGPALEYLQDSAIGVIHLRNAINVDLSLLSHVETELSLETCDIRDFTTLSDKASFRYLTVSDCSYLKSLDGIEKIRDYGTKEDAPHGFLYLENCPRLTDWSALEGLHLEEMWLVGMDSVPDFSTFTAESYRLEGISGLTDLTCFEGLAPDRTYSFDLSGLEDLTDISALRHLKGGHLCVRPELREEAEALVSSGVFESCEVRYPDAPWQPDTRELKLLSLDELETLPATVQSRVASLSAAGDLLYDEEEYRLEEDWSTDKVALYLTGNDPEKDERIPVKKGTRLTDLSVLKDLTGLRDLHLSCQPVKTLNGLQYLESLENLSIEHCSALEDASAAFTLQQLTSLSLRRNEKLSSVQGIRNLYNLERLELDGSKIDDISQVFELDGLRSVCVRNTRVTSIEGIQNLKKLTCLIIENSPIADLSPLGDIDYSFCMEPDEDGRTPRFELTLAWLEQPFTPEDFAGLASVPYFEYLNLNGSDCRLWTDALRETPVRRMEFCDCDWDNDTFRAFIEQHPETEEIDIRWNPDLTDLSPLYSLPILRRVTISHNMSDAESSLDGDFNFDLEIRD
ncbi:MAG: hypothetical protein IJK86_09970 [Lachnospiraceae bacterium]|nr:hypothetical protein [Lachnospiraceae bacterium]